MGFCFQYNLIFLNIHYTRCIKAKQIILATSPKKHVVVFFFKRKQKIRKEKRSIEDVECILHNFECKLHVKILN